MSVFARFDFLYEREKAMTERQGRRSQNDFYVRHELTLRL